MKLHEIIRQKRKTCEKEINELILESQLNCAHEKVVEAPYDKDAYYFHSPPFRVCEECGFAEQSWSCGNQVLRATSYYVTRDYAHEITVGKNWENHLFIVKFGEKLSQREKYEEVLRKEYK